MSAWRSLCGAGSLAIAATLAIGACPAFAQVLPAHSAPDAPTAAQVLADSLWHRLGQLRGLRADGSVHVQVVEPARVQSRASALATEEQGHETAGPVLQHLGISPGDASHCMQNGGFYDVDARLVLLEAGLDADATRQVLAHALVGALQDQHFSVRVRRKLGFDSRDARAAWHALLCGDADVVSAELLRAAGQAPAGADPVATATPGAAFVQALRSRGGWRRVDAAYVHLPLSTEQVLHPERYLADQDAPVHVEVADVRGFLGAGSVPVSEARLGERDLAEYFRQHADSSLAVEAAAGWGGSQAVLYSEPGQTTRTLVLYTIWDSETDAMEAFDALMRGIVARYGDGRAIRDASSSDLAVWSTDDAGRVHALQLRGRSVVALEHAPAASLTRILKKIERDTLIDDPTPDVRTADKNDLPWNQLAGADGDSMRTLHVDLPAGWARLPEAGDLAATSGFQGKVVMAAQRDAATLCVAIDPAAHDALGAGGFAHSVARRIQERGHGVYSRRDQGSRGGSIYEHVFLQAEGQPGAEADVVYSIAVVPMAQGFGCVIVREPGLHGTPPASTDFDAILAGLRFIQEDANPKLAAEPLGTPAPTRN